MLEVPAFWQDHANECNIHRTTSRGSIVLRTTLMVKAEAELTRRVRILRELGMVRKVVIMAAVTNRMRV